jgi:hypothetical protein
MARVLQDRNRLDEAAAAALEVIRLDPDDPDYWAWLAAVRIDQRRWQEGL